MDKREKILLVEDDLVNRKVISLMLLEEGYDVDTASDGFEAFKKQCAETYASILMDMQLPGIDGLQTVRMIREWERSAGRRTPIAAMTAFAFGGVHEDFAFGDVDDYIAKPIDVDQLYRIVGKLCGRT
ncbi:response regulator [Paenibacillus thermotolerans]|uniref:response regulator n=1 Tax=Paenibacillus thermotolerans TaxID=3027807 RepID=UPI002367C440|nr:MULTISPECIES: response regulator [unclassified Paenibacillus]